VTAKGLSRNGASLAWFATWVASQRDPAFDDYRQRLNRSLVTQQREQLTQLAVLGATEAVFAAALQVLDALAFDMDNVMVERGRSALTPEVQKPFRDFMQSLLDDAVAFNRTSCALSNFPHEHRPSQDYLQTILRDIAAAWQEFSLAANRLLLAKADAAERRSTHA
jgi:monoamine oxidase